MSHSCKRLRSQSRTRPLFFYPDGFPSSTISTLLNEWCPVMSQPGGIQRSTCLTLLSSTSLQSIPLLRIAIWSLGNTSWVKVIGLLHASSEMFSRYAAYLIWCLYLLITILSALQGCDTIFFARNPQHRDCHTGYGLRRRTSHYGCHRSQIPFRHQGCSRNRQKNP